MTTTQYRPGAQVHSAMAWIALIGTAIVTYAVYKTPLGNMNYLDCAFYAVIASIFFAHNACCYGNPEMIHKKLYTSYPTAFGTRAFITLMLWITCNAIAFGHLLQAGESSLHAFVYLLSSALSVWGVYHLFKKWMYSRYYLDYEAETVIEISLRSIEIYKVLISHTKPNHEDEAQYKMATNPKNLADARSAKRYLESRILYLQNKKY